MAQETQQQERPEVTYVPEDWTREQTEKFARDNPEAYKRLKKREERVQAEEAGKAEIEEKIQREVKKLSKKGIPAQEIQQEIMHKYGIAIKIERKRGEPREFEGEIHERARKGELTKKEAEYYEKIMKKQYPGIKFKEPQEFEGEIHERARKGELTPGQAETYKRVMKEQYGIELGKEGLVGVDTPEEKIQREVKKLSKKGIPAQEIQQEIMRKYGRATKIDTGTIREAAQREDEHWGKGIIPHKGSPRESSEEESKAIQELPEKQREKVLQALREGKSVQIYQPSIKRYRDITVSPEQDIPSYFLAGEVDTAFGEYRTKKEPTAEQTLSDKIITFEVGQGFQSWLRSAETPDFIPFTDADKLIKNVAFAPFIVGSQLLKGQFSGAEATIRGTKLSEAEKQEIRESAEFGRGGLWLAGGLGGAHLGSGARIGAGVGKARRIISGWRRTGSRPPTGRTYAGTQPALRNYLLSPEARRPPIRWQPSPDATVPTEVIARYKPTPAYDVMVPGRTTGAFKRYISTTGEAGFPSGGLSKQVLRQQKIQPTGLSSLSTTRTTTGGGLTLRSPTYGLGVEEVESRTAKQTISKQGGGLVEPSTFTVVRVGDTAKPRETVKPTTSMFTTTKPTTTEEERIKGFVSPAFGLDLKTGTPTKEEAGIKAEETVKQDIGVRLGVRTDVGVAEKTLFDYSFIPKFSLTGEPGVPGTPGEPPPPLIPSVEDVVEKKKKTAKRRRGKRRPFGLLASFVNLNITEAVTGEEAVHWMDPGKMRGFWRKSLATAFQWGVPTYQQVKGETKGKKDVGGGKMGIKVGNLL